MEEDDDEDEVGDSLRCGNDGAWTAAGNNNNNNKKTKLQRIRDPEKKLQELFQEIDTDKDGLLSR
jgi:hypothetical protein